MPSSRLSSLRAITSWTVYTGQSPKRLYFLKKILLYERDRARMIGERGQMEREKQTPLSAGSLMRDLIPGP